MFSDEEIDDLRLRLGESTDCGDCLYACLVLDRWGPIVEAARLARRHGYNNVFLRALSDMLLAAESEEG